MTAELRARFLILDGLWIAIKDIAGIGNDGVFLHDGRFIAGSAQ